MVAIRISPTTPVTVLTSERFLGISSVPVGMPFRGAVKHVLAVNSDVEGLVVYMVTTAHAGDMNVAENARFQKLILIGRTPLVDDLAAE